MSTANISSNDAGVVYVVDDDQPCRTVIAKLASSFGYEVVCFASAEEFLDYRRTAKKACAVVDNRMTGMSGVDLQSTLVANGDDLPLIFLTGYARTTMVVQAMRQGALTLLEKPVRSETLREALDEAFKKLETSNLRRTDPSQESLETARLIYLLSRRESEVAKLVAVGFSNKKIAAELGLSEKTIEKYRANCVRKLRVGSSAELVRAVVTAEIMGISN